MGTDLMALCKRLILYLGNAQWSMFRFIRDTLSNFGKKLICVYESKREMIAQMIRW